MSIGPAGEILRPAGERAAHPHARLPVAVLPPPEDLARRQSICRDPPPAPRPVGGQVRAGAQWWRLPTFFACASCSVTDACALLPSVALTALIASR
jgi:hypothetical protein